jgi:hypothetical protein
MAEFKPAKETKVTVWLFEIGTETGHPFQRAKLLQTKKFPFLFKADMMTGCLSG